MRLVLDTNVVISAALAARGSAGQVFRLAFERPHVLLASEVTLAELERKLFLPKFDRYTTREVRESLATTYRRTVKLVSVDQTVTQSNDPDDNHFLALALCGRADCLVSGDKKHLLVLGSFEGIPIFSPADFLAQVAVGQ